MSGGSEKGDESEDDEYEEMNASPWPDMSAELAALSTPGTVGQRGRGRAGSAQPDAGSEASDDAGDDEVSLLYPCLVTPSHL